MDIDVSVRKQLGTLAIALDFTVDGGRVAALFGPSGSGKTTAIKLIAGMLRPDDGHVRVGGTTFFDRPAGIDLPPERRRIGFVFQDSRLFPHLSVRNNLLYGWRRAPMGDRRIAPDEVIGLLGLDGLMHRRPHGLSGGERQRVALGRALLAQPRLLLMDEPLAALDSARKGEILTYIERLRDEFGLPIIYVSHAVEEVSRLADTMIVIRGGKVLATGPTLDVMTRPDLRDVTGADFGAVLEATVLRHDTRFGLTVLSTAGGELRVPRVEAPVGKTLRVHVRARDTALALYPPDGSSVLNVLSGHIAAVEDEVPPHAIVRIDLGGGAALLAAITRLSVHRLRLKPGDPVYALIKAMALDRGAGR